MFEELIFLKLGGSLITDKNKISTASPDIIARIGEEILELKEALPKLRIFLGHGSGSFGHKPAKKYKTRQGVNTEEEWKGFTEVWFEASSLNRIVVETLHQVGLPVISYPASSSTISENGKILSWNLDSIQSAMNNNITPLVFGDVCFDTVLGGTILSTEDIFSYFSVHLKPQKILLAGSGAGVFADYPKCKELIPEISSDNYQQVLPVIQGSAATDVTGGMASKVKEMMDLTKKIEELEVFIFSGKEKNGIKNILNGKQQGTRITN